jgi:O-acetyl-ADP-ribose deacetylase (regulator of RNase III)
LCQICDFLFQESIVSCNNERFTSMEGVTGDIMRRVGPQLRAFIEGECGQDGCRTGDGICSPTFGRLPAPHILHAIAPRYTPQYHDAAIYALHSCVRRVFEIAKENNIHEVAFSVLHTESKKFPHGLAIGVCLRTIRRMLEHYRAWFYRVIICTQDDQQLKEYEATMPVYFPRTPAETRRVVHMLPPDVGSFVCFFVLICFPCSFIDGFVFRQ